MKVLLTGSRNWTDEELVREILSDFPEDTTIISGGARGLDTIAYRVGRELHMKVVTIYADWERYGKSAGPIRNRKMLDMNPDLVIAFHDNFYESKGTRDCVYEAQQRGIPVRMIKHEN